LFHKDKIDYVQVLFNPNRSLSFSTAKSIKT